MIETKGVHIGYKKSLVSVADLTLASGVYILIGRNGSGKSTFLKTLTAQIPSIAGEIVLNGKNLKELNVHEIPAIVSFVGSQFPIVEFLRVEEYVALSRSPYTNFFGSLKEKDIDQVNAALNALHIEHLKSRFTSELSDGEKQMVAIAKALAQETPIIVLDEPTAFLDYANKKRVLENLVRVASEFNKCIVLSSHDIDLSIEVSCPFLVFDPNTDTIEIKSGLTKSELIKIAFEI